MESTVILGWLLLICCANSESPTAFANRIKEEPEMQQLVNYLREHKEEVTQYLLAEIENKQASKKLAASMEDTADIQWYLDYVVNR
jgi:hypothetical protein